MARRNKIRYRSKGNPFPLIAMTGKVFLRHRDDALLGEAQKGDIMVFLSTDILLGDRVGDYNATGLEGYLKADLFDGKGWKPLSLEEFFPGRDHYFGKRERPADTFAFCLDHLQAAANAQLMRTYREHYVKIEPSSESEH